MGMRPKLKDSLDLLTSNDPPLDPCVIVDYIVIRRVNRGTHWFTAEFVNGDNVDDKEWFEGPFHQQMSVRELFGKRRKYLRDVR